jgi:hypothetical protein
VPELLEGGALLLLEKELELLVDNELEVDALKLDAVVGVRALVCVAPPAPREATPSGRPVLPPQPSNQKTHVAGATN